MKSPSLTLTLIAIVLATPFISSADTVGYWRFENASNVGQDYGPNSLNMSNSTTPVTSTATVFPNPVPQTGESNLLAGAFDSSQDRFLSVADSSAFAFQDFTIEAYVRLDSASTGSTPSMIAGQLDTSNSAWQFGTTGGGSGLGARRLFLQMSTSGSAVGTIASIGDAFLLDLGSNYYVAVSVHFTGTGVEATFFIKDLTTDSELHSSIVTAGNTSMYNSTADFTIGATYQDGVDARHFSGLIDEVRLSNTALSEGQLLTIPEPAESAMFLSTGLLMLALLRRLRLKK